MAERLEINGVKTNVEVAGEGPALILLHGFTGSATGWGQHFAKFAETHRVIAIDALGHGLSDAPNDPTRYDMSYVIADFLTILDKLGIEKTALLGYSMGGRMALAIALAAPKRITHLVLESASPGLSDAAERRVRTESDNALADRIERDGIEAFVDYWEKLPLWQSQAQLPEEVRASQRATRLKNNPRSLVNSLRGLGTGVQPSFWDILDKLTMPTLLITGELDPKFCTIARHMQEAIPNASHTIIPGAGHAAHLERPEEFDRIVNQFLTTDKCLELV